MEIRRGKDRIVILLPYLGVAIKLPIVRIATTVRVALRNAAANKWAILRLYWSAPIDEFFGFRKLIFGGIAANWIEYHFYRETHHPFLMPTYYSLFGILNVQHLGEPLRVDAHDLLTQLDTITNRQVLRDVHHFMNPKNFCFSNGRLRMFDYGSKKCCAVIASHGKAMFERFIPEPQHAS